MHFIKIILKYFIFIISGHTHVLRGWLSESETRELLAIMEEKEMSLHGVLLSAAIASIGKAYALKNMTSLLQMLLSTGSSVYPH